MKKVRNILCGFVLVSLSSLAGASTPPLLSETIKKIQFSKGVEFVGEKKMVSQVMGTEKKIKMRALFSGAKFRIESPAPEKSLAIYDGSMLTLVQYPDPSVGGSIVVNQGKVSAKQREQMILSELLMAGKLLKSFESSLKEETSEVATFIAKPKDKSMSIQSVLLKISKKDNQLNSIGYVDDIGNETNFEIQEQKNLKGVKASAFVYKMEKGAQLIKF